MSSIMSCIIRFPGNFGGFSRRLNVRFVFACRVGRRAKCCTASEVPWTDRSSVGEFDVHPVKPCETKSAPGHALVTAAHGTCEQPEIATTAPTPRGANGQSLAGSPDPQDELARSLGDMAGVT